MLNPKDYIYSNPDGEVDEENTLLPFINYQKSAPQRCLDMLLAKYRGEDYQSEVIMTAPKQTEKPELSCALKDATILLITDGGLVPRGNPNHMPLTNADFFGIYSIAWKDRLSANDYEVSHQGYDNRYVEEDPNRLLPVDVLREMEKAHQIGNLYHSFLSTSGVMTSTKKSQMLGQKIAKYVKNNPIDAVIISSVCGTSTRCGAYIGLAIEELGIPVVQVTNLDTIAEDTGVHRIIKGNNICYPFGDPALSKKRERIYRRKLVESALQTLI